MILKRYILIVDVAKIFLSIHKVFQKAKICLLSMIQRWKLWSMVQISFVNWIIRFTVRTNQTPILCINYKNQWILHSITLSNWFLCWIFEFVKGVLSTAKISNIPKCTSLYLGEWDNIFRCCTSKKRMNKVKDMSFSTVISILNIPLMRSTFSKSYKQNQFRKLLMV
jgi:hypothetical protein